MIAFAGVTGALGLAVLSAGLPSVASTEQPTKLRIFADRDVRSCALLDDGVLVGTQGGVVRLDQNGTVVATVRAADGLPGAQTDAIVVRDGEAFVATEGGVARIDLATDTVVAAAKGPPARALAWDAGGLLVGTWGQGVARWDGGDSASRPLAFATKADGPSRRITDIVSMGTTTFAATAGGGVFEVRGDRLTPSAIAPSNAVVFSLAVQDGHQGDAPSLFVGGLDGVHLVREGTPTPYARHDARAMAMGPNGPEFAAIGIGLIADGVTGPKGVVLPRDLDVQGDRRCLATDNGVWLGEGDTWTHALDSGLPSGDIAALAIDGEERWVGTFDRGLVHFDGVQWRDVPGVPLEVNAVIVVPGSPGAFVGTTSGLFHVHDGRVDQFTTKNGLPSDKIQTLDVLAGVELLIGTAHGVRIMEHGRLRTPAGGRDWSVFATAQAPDKTVWIGTARGLVHLTGTGKWTHYSMLSGHLPDDWVTALNFVGDELYIGTYGHGVVHMARNTAGKWRTNELGGGRVNIGGLTLDGTTMYASTMDGLLTRELDAPAPEWTRDRHAGNGRDTTALRVSDDGIWIASRRGLAFRPH